LLYPVGFGLGMSIVLAVSGFATLFLSSRKVITLKAPWPVVAIPFVVASYGFGFTDSNGLDTLNFFTFVLSLGVLSFYHSSTKLLALSESLIFAPFR
jgi:hypothetical protein